MDAISYTIDCEKDLKLYHIVYGFSNEYMGVIVVEILGEELQQIYDNKAFLLRCYKRGVKFFEMPMCKIF